MSTQNIINPNETEEEKKKEPLSEEKCCVNCKTTKTPLWRSGPAGPKSLCNACGIRQRKKRESKHLVIDSSKVENNNDNNKKRRKCVKEENNSSSSMRNEEKREICVGNGKEGKLCGDLRRNVMALGKKVVFLQRQRSPIRRQRQRQRQRQNSSSGSSTYEKMGEVEQAAMLLIAMSCGSVFA